MAVLLLLLWSTAAAATIGDLARRDTGDVFTILGGECGPAQCVEYGAGSGVPRNKSLKGECSCSCPQRAPLFREDRELCVDDLPECSLATFGTGTGIQRIPFVYLPLKGQIIHPSREITFHNVKTPICAVSGAQFLTRKGFLDLRNTIDADVPFSLFRDEGRTFLQWSGEDEVRRRMTGRVMVVHLLCRDIATTPISPLDLRGVFTPCVAFRVQGTPPRHSNNISEVLFASNAQTSETSNTSGLSITEYIAIGISSLLLGLIYVASVFLYLHIKKRRKAAAAANTLKNFKVLRKKDGTAITEHDIIRINNERAQSLANVLGQDDGVIKKNPLLNVGRQFHDSKNFANDLSDSEDFADSNLQCHENTNFQQSTTSVVIHRHVNEFKHQSDGLELNHRDESSIERLPDEHVSIVETIDDREITRPVGTTRRKLYFNPAYFEPHLMADPPAAAIEFLSKIREVIAIAKQKMATKRFHPVLNLIPEEETYPSNGNSIDIYQGTGSQQSGSIVSLKRANSRKRSTNCLGCPGCKSNNNDNDVQTLLKYNMTTCSNCLGDKGDKQSSIRKWLENIPSGKQQVFYNENQTQNLAMSLLSLPTNEKQCKLRKQNSFNMSKTSNSDEFLRSKKTTSRSVRSEPSLRNYNIPIPEFDDDEYDDNHCHTESSVDDIRHIEFNSYDKKSVRQNNDPAIRSGNSVIKNNNTLPDMVNEAIALDHFSRSSYVLSSSDEERCSKDITGAEINNANIKNNLDTPSGNEYETDSLERTSNKKSKSSLTDYPDIPSSQASPSLSNALPLEEELTMRNAVYKTNSSSNSNTPSPEGDVHVDDNHYEVIEIKKISNQVAPKKNVMLKHNTNYSLVSEVYVNNSYNFGSTPTSPSGSDCSMGSRKADNFEKRPGCLTIEVKDPPENYIRIHESDGFEPDTLDRKHPKHKEIIDSVQFSRKDLLKNIETIETRNRHRIQLRSSGTFSKNSGKVDSLNKFNSLRNDNENQRLVLNRPKLSPNIYSGSKSLDNITDDNWDDNGDWASEESRILTLELRHSKRQRQSTPPTIKQLKNLARPDVLPPLIPTAEDNPIYENPRTPHRRFHCETTGIGNRVEYDRSGSPNQCITNIITESSSGNLSPRNSICESSRSPMTCSTFPLNSEYEDANREQSSHSDVKENDSSNSTKETPYFNGAINTNTFVRSHKGENPHRTKFRRKKGSTIEDSGYLSSDSTNSKQFQRKIVIAKITSCSESDDTGDEARSESGAESIETHSVYFGNCQKLQFSADNTKDTNKVPRDSKKKPNVSSENISQ